MLPLPQDNRPTAKALIVGELKKEQRTSVAASPLFIPLGRIGRESPAQSLTLQRNHD